MSHRKKLGIFGILKEAVLSLERNIRMVASIIVLVIIPLTLLHTFPTLNPSLVVDVAPILSGLPLSILQISNPNYVELPIRPVEMFISQLLTPIWVYLSAMAGISRNFGSKDLQYKVRRTWIGLMITSLWIQLTMASYVFILLMLGIFMHMVPDLVSVMSGLFTVALVVSFLPIFIVGRLSLVVAVAEEGCYGINAIRRACSITRRRKLHGLVLLLLMGLLRAALLSTQMVAAGHSNEDGWKLSSTVAAVLNSAHYNLVSVFEYMVFTVYYYECKKSYGVRGKKEAAHKLMFSLL